MEENPGVVTSSSLRGEIAQSIMDSLRVLLRRTNSSEGQCGLGLVGGAAGRAVSKHRTDRAKHLGSVTGGVHGTHGDSHED